MAIAFDKSGAARTGTTTTVNLAAASSNELAIIWVWFGTISAMTVGGSNATLIGSINFDTGQNIYAYYFANPPTTSTAYTVTAGNTVELHVLLYSGASLTGVPDSQNSKDDPAANPLTLTTNVVAANSWLVSAARDYASGAQTAGTGTTLRNAGTGMSSGDSNGTVGTGNQSMGWIPNTAGETTAGFIISLAPTSTGGATTNNLSLLGVGT